MATIADDGEPLRRMTMITIPPGPTRRNAVTPAVPQHLLRSRAGSAALSTDTDQCRRSLAGIQYCLQITGNRIHVTPHEEQVDYSAAVQDTFARFKQGTVKDYRVAYSHHPAMNHVEAQVLDMVADIYPDQFA